MKKLSEYAKQHNVTYRTAFNHFHKGLISGAYQLPSGTIVIPDHAQQVINQTDYVVTYARVSSSENKINLTKQSQRLIDYCNAKGWTTQENISEIGSGINDNRQKLLKIFETKKVTKLVVEHKDRLTRFGFNYIQTICNLINCEIIILNETNGEKEDIVQDFVSIITSFCAKIYGQRRGQRKTELMIKELKELNDSKL